MIGNVPVMEEIDGVKVVNICRLIEVLFPVRSWNNPTYKEEGAKLREWLTANDAAYYADVKEDFFIWRGVDLAKKEGKTIVVVENLS
ncbi:MAG: hypothetical protein K0R18_379 [Bacillales bacterium]|nr:hypothetical protein [Bacillales bacterium]